MITVKKKFIGFICSSLIVASSSFAAYADGTFLCMNPDQSTAISTDENNNFQYIEMRASNGQLVYPQISTNGNTYLPFRYVCEMAGLKDGAEIPGALPDGYFRYWAADPSIPGDKQKIEIQFDGSYYCHNIGESFQYEVKEGDIRTVSIYNIRGSLYFPMTYMAKITNAQAIWHDNTQNIIYVSNSQNNGELLDERNELRRDKLLQLGFDFFANNLGNSPLYLKSDGQTIQNLSDELEGNPKVKSITRSGSDIYFVDDSGKICVKNEYSETANHLSFTDTNGNSIDVTAETAIVVKNKLYGIHVSSPSETSGRLFVSNLNGSGFSYLNNQTVYNLTVKKRGSDMFMFYCDAATKSTLHMIEMKTMDNYEIELTNYAHENLLSDIKQFIVGEKMVSYISNDNRLHVISMNDNLEDFEILRVDNSAHKIYVTGEDGESLDNITSMNYDYINNVLYVTQVDYTGRNYYYTKSIDNFRRLERSEHPMTDIALFSDVFYNDYCAKTVNGKPQINRVTYSNGAVEISE